jgi:alpha-glucosidase
MADFGYDVADYCDVDPVFGTLDDFDRLLADCHDRGLRLLVDWVPNHTSSRHPWFLQSRSSRSNPRRDWYIWRDPAEDGGPPNNWVRSWSDQPAWTFDPETGQYYLHLFLPEQPDLNWANAEVQEAMHQTLRFWLDRGVDGFRMDVIHCIGKDPALADDPPELARHGHVPLNDRPETHELLRGIRRVLDRYDGDRVAVGEVWLLDTRAVATYYGHGDELQLSFNFPPLLAPWSAASWRRQIERAEAELGPVHAWPTWVLSNHDVVRHRTRYGSEARARAAAALLLTLRGTPFLYAGEELGLEQAVIPPERVVDPGGRDGCRAPIPWTPDPDHGWGGAEPWLPWPPDPADRNVATERQDPSSMLSLYRRLLAARRRSPALRTGRLVLLDTDDPVLAYRRELDDDERVVLINFGDEPVAVSGAGVAAEPDGAAASGVIEVSTVGRGEGGPFRGELGPSEAVILRPAG